MSRRRKNIRLPKKTPVRITITTPCGAVVEVQSRSIKGRPAAEVSAPVGSTIKIDTKDGSQ